MWRYFNRIGHLYNRYIRGHHEEPRFLIIISFLFTFILTRLTVYNIRYHFFPSPFGQNIYFKEIHIHHLVFGIFLLLIAGLIRIPQFGKELFRVSSVLYGMGAALTLDEFSLWLHLDPDVYFGREGRISIDAVVLFLLLLLSSLWYGVFWKKLFQYTVQFAFFRLKKLFGTLQIFMKKKKISKKGQAKPRTKKKTSSHLFSWLVLVLVIFAIGYSGYIVGSREPSILSHKLVSTKAIAAMEPQLTVTPTPTPIETPTPTTEPTPVYSGYCMSVPVLMYHHVEPWGIAQAKNHTSLDVDPGFFDQQMGYLASHGYTPYFAEDLVNALVTKTSLAGKPIVVTLDDGYDDVYNYAFPILKKYGMKATVFVPSGLLGVVSGTNTYYTWGQLNDMLGSGLVSVGNHTWSHYPVGSSTPEKDAYEITTAEGQIQQYTSHHAPTFAYPYGTNAGMERVHAELQKDGFPGAFSTISGTYQCDSFIMSLHRTRIGNSNFPAFGIL